MNELLIAPRTVLSQSPSGTPRRTTGTEAELGCFAEPATFAWLVTTQQSTTNVDMPLSPEMQSMLLSAMHSITTTRVIKF